MLKREDILQKAVDIACRDLAGNTRRRGQLERIVEDVIGERPDLARDVEALAEQALRRLPEFIKHIEER